MKILAPFVFTLLLTGCTESTFLTLVNTSEQPLENQSIIVQRTDTNVTDGEYLLILNDEKEPIPVQYDDLNLDGQWDELVFALDFDAKESKRLEYTRVDKNELPNFEKRTAAHLGFSPERNGQFESVKRNVRPEDHIAQSQPFLYQFEGPGWENEWVGFRSYFDSRNGKDIFGKSRPQLYLSQIGLNENYHELQDWGMDILKVGNSLGAGAIAMLKDDSLYRLSNTEKATFEILTEGPVRTVIQFSYEGWEVAGASYDLTETISIWAGKRHYESELTLSGDGGDTFVTGLVNLKSLDDEIITLSNKHILYTHGRQSENKDVLGMAVLVPTENFIAFSEAPKTGTGISNTYTALLKPAAGVYRFAFFVGWQLENAKFANEENFVKALKETTLSTHKLIDIKF